VILAALQNMGPDARPAVPALLELLRTNKYVYSDAVLDTLGRIGPAARDSISQLLTLLKADSEYDRARAARALGRIGPEARAALPVLKELLEDEKKWVRAWAVFALMRISGDIKSRLPVLVELWSDNEEEDDAFGDVVRYELAQIFELLGPDASPVRNILLGALLDRRTRFGTHGHVARALGQLRGDADLIVPRLLLLLDRQAEGDARAFYCSHAAEALGLLGPKARAAIPRLLQLLEDENEVIVTRALDALEKIEAK
jgi:HEAT repeat protein